MVAVYIDESAASAFAVNCHVILYSVCFALFDDLLCLSETQFKVGHAGQEALHITFTIFFLQLQMINL